MLLAQAWRGGRARGGTRLVSQGHGEDGGASWWDHVGHPGTGIPIMHSMGTAHALTPTAGSAGRVGAMGCSGRGLLRGPAPSPASKAPHGEMWGKGSAVRARELQRVVGQAPAKITPPIFLLQELRDKRDLQDLPAIQIEYLILAAGEEWGLGPRGTWRCAGSGSRGCPASRGGISSSQRRTDARANTRDWAAPCWWDRAPNLPLIPPATRQLPTVRHSLRCHVGATAGSSPDEPRVWPQCHGCSGGGSGGALGPACCPWASPEPTLGCCLLRCTSPLP